jgi:hypothetical protein
MARNGCSLRGVLEQIGLSRARYYRWLERATTGDLTDHVIVPCSWRRPLSEEEEAVVEFALAHPQDGYRRLAWMMVDADVAYLRPSAVYGVLDRRDLLSRWKRSVSVGQKPPEPTFADEIWHTDLSYIRVPPRWYYLAPDWIGGLQDYHWARDVVAQWVCYYNEQRLHSALHYLRPIDYYRGDPQALLAQRNEKLAAAVEQRAARWKEQLAKTPGV